MYIPNCLVKNLVWKTQWDKTKTKGKRVQCCSLSWLEIYLPCLIELSIHPAFELNLEIGETCQWHMLCRISFNDHFLIWAIQASLSSYTSVGSSSTWFDDKYKISFFRVSRASGRDCLIMDLVWRTASLKTLLGKTQWDKNQSQGKKSTVV